MPPLPAQRRNEPPVKLRSILDVLELNVAIFALLLNFPWEFLQAPLFKDMASAPHWAAVKVCGLSTLGDALIALVAFWSVAATVRSRRWILRPTPRQVAGFVAVGLVITVLAERLGTGLLHRWAYAPAMPVIPVLGVGLSPILQWVALPLALVWFVRRQLSQVPSASSTRRAGPSPTRTCGASSS
jgi:hypothetical protein